MAAGDLHNNIKISRAISPVSPAATGAITGQVIDRANFPDLEFVIAAGAQTTTGITVTPLISHGTVTGTLTSAPDSALLGTEAAAATILAGSGGANKVAKIGYKGANRYVRCNLTVAGAATGVYSVTAVQSGARKAPV